MKNKKIFLGLALLAVVALVFFLFSDSQEEKKPASGEKKLPELEFLGTKLTETVDKTVNWELNSKSIQVDKEKNLIFFQQNNGVFYQNKEKALTMEGEKGYFDLKKKDLSLVGKVKLTSAKGETLQAKKIKFYSQNKKIIGEGSIVFRRGNTTVTGNTFQTDMNFKTIEVTGNVQVNMEGN